MQAVLLVLLRDTEGGDTRLIGEDPGLDVRSVVTIGRLDKVIKFNT